MTSDEKYDIERRIAQLPAEEQLQIIEQLLRQFRQTFHTDHDAIAEEMRQMAEDPDIQRVLRGEDLQRDEAR